MVTTGQTGWKSHGLKATRRLWYMIKSDRRMGYPEMPALIIGFRVARKLAINPRLQQTNSKSCSATCREIGQDMTEYCDVQCTFFFFSHACGFKELHVLARSLLFYKAFMQKLFQSSVSEMSQVDDGKAWLKGLEREDPNAADPGIVPGPYFRIKGT